MVDIFIVVDLLLANGLWLLLALNFMVLYALVLQTVFNVLAAVQMLWLEPVDGPMEIQNIDLRPLSFIMHISVERIGIRINCNFMVATATVATSVAQTF